MSLWSSPGHRLNSSGEEPVNASALSFEYQKAPAEAGAEQSIKSNCTHEFLSLADQLLCFFPSEALLSLTSELDELAFFLGHGVSRMWDLSRTPAPSLLSFGSSGSSLVSRRNTCGEEQVS